LVSNITRRKKKKMTVFGNGAEENKTAVLRVGWIELHNEDLQNDIFNQILQDDQIKKDKMSRTRSMHQR
jgi:hypothetical protein